MEFEVREVAFIAVSALGREDEVVFPPDDAANACAGTPALSDRAADWYGNRRRYRVVSLLPDRSRSGWSWVQLSGEIRLLSETPLVYWNFVVSSVKSLRR